MQLVELALFTDDVPAMTAFYARLFGTPPEQRSGGGHCSSLARSMCWFTPGTNLRRISCRRRIMLRSASGTSMPRYNAWKPPA